MKSTKTLILFLVIAASLVVTPLLAPQRASSIGPNAVAQPIAGVNQDIPPAVQQIINQAFQAVSGTVIQFANNVNTWKTQAQQAANKTASDFTSCPSPAAQTLYNDLKDKQSKLQTIINQATAADQQALIARGNCFASVPNTPAFKAACSAAYNNLPFLGIKSSAQAAKTAVDNALNVLKALKCISGCSKNARAVFPTVGVQPGKPQPGPSITVCTQWKAGQFSYNLDAGNGELDAGVHAKLPSCAKTQTYPLTGCDWQVSVLLPELKRLRLVPPDVQVRDVTITIPNTTVSVLTGFNQSCTQPLEVCKTISGSGNFTFSLGSNPIASLNSAMQSVSAQCTQKVTVGCLNPAFGLNPVFSNIGIPDPTKAKITWGGLTAKPGSITVDLSAREYSIACRAKPLAIPGLPTVTIGKQVVEFPFLCLTPQWKNLVASQ